MPNRIRSEYPAPTPMASTLVALLQMRAIQQADQMAFDYLADGEQAHRTVTYQQLDQQARAIAATLQSSLLSSGYENTSSTGQRAVLLYPPGIEYIAAFFGCLYAQVIPVPAYPPRANRPSERLESMVLDAQPAFILTTASIRDTLEKTLTHAPYLNGLTLLATEDISSDQAEQWEEPFLTESTLAFLQYTSGSTAMPKGVMLTHSNILHYLEMMLRHYGSSKSAVIWLPPYHDLGLIGGILGPLYEGVPATLMAPTAFMEKPIRWLQAISETGASISGGPNFAFDLCTRQITDEQRATLDLSCWRIAFCGSEQIRPHTLERFAKAFAACGFQEGSFRLGYGLAEATLMVVGTSESKIPTYLTVKKEALAQHRVVTTDASDPAPHSLVSCGYPLRGQRIVIVNPDSLTECAVDEVGEIWVAGANVAGGYWNREALSQNTFCAYLADTREGPFLRTGDLGFTAHGNLYVTGRIKEMIIIRGRNYYPQDIELTVERCHPVLQTLSGAAFSLDTQNEERLVIVQEVTRQYRSVNLTQVLQQIRDSVFTQHHLTPSAIILIRPASLPRTTSGKIQRNATRAAYLSGELTLIADWTDSAGPNLAL